MIFLSLSTEAGIDLLLADGCAKWSPSCARLVMEHLEFITDETGDPIEFDRVAIRCEYFEYPSIEDAASDYDMTPEELEDRTTVLHNEHSPIVVVKDFC